MCFTCVWHRTSFHTRIDKKNDALIDTASHPNTLCGSNFCSSRVSKANVPTGNIPAFGSSENITRLLELGKGPWKNVFCRALPKRGRKAPARIFCHLSPTDLLVIKWKRGNLYYMKNYISKKGWWSLNTVDFYPRDVFFKNAYLLNFAGCKESPLFVEVSANKMSLKSVYLAFQWTNLPIGRGWTEVDQVCCCCCWLWFMGIYPSRWIWRVEFILGTCEVNLWI